MNDTVQPEGARIVAARDRLYDLLGASNAAEGEVIRYLTRALPIDAVELLVTMAERELKRVTADGYDRGYLEGIERLSERQRAAEQRPTSEGES